MPTLKENEMKNNVFRRLLAMAAAGAMLTSIGRMRLVVQR